MKSIKKYKAVVLALMIILISITGPIMAQTSTPDNTATGADHDGDRDYSWIGLIGLAGLLGLAGRKRIEASTQRTATR